MLEVKNMAIESLFPAFLLADKNGYAMARGIMRGLEMAGKAIKNGLDTVLDVDKMPEWRLDQVAHEYAADWYDHGADVETKRAQVKGALDFYNRLGTRYAVERAIEAVYGAGRVEEWFEYGGEPGYFRVYAGDISALEEKREKFMALLRTVKNARSVLENVYYYGSAAQAGFFTAAAVTGAMGKGEAVAVM